MEKRFKSDSEENFWESQDKEEGEIEHDGIEVELEENPNINSGNSDVSLNESKGSDVKVGKNFGGKGMKKRIIDIDGRIEIGTEMNQLKTKNAQDEYLSKILVDRKRALEYKRDLPKMIAKVKAQGPSGKKYKITQSEYPEVDSGLYLWYCLQTSAHPNLNFSGVILHLKANEIYLMLHLMVLDSLLKGDKDENAMIEGEVKVEEEAITGITLSYSSFLFLFF
jgi:hypothetical protein